MTDPTGRPVAIIDIGSNSVRLVIFSRLARVPPELHTEQIYPHLGREIGKTGRLDAAGRQLCLDGLRRYATLCRSYGVEEKIVVATAAVREASDGPAFVDAIRQATGLDVAILGGAEEGRLSALGVLSGIPHADGMVGDIGGGSLELALVEKGHVGERTTLPLGPFRLQRQGDHRARHDELVRFVDGQLASVPWLAEAKGRSFYAVGGNWRAIAKAQIKRDQHPLDIVHQHALSLRESLEFTGFLSTLSQQSLERFAVAKKRARLVPYAALALERVLRAVKPQSLVFSGYGLREGIAFDRLNAADRALDPLFESCRAVVSNPIPGEILSRWTDAMFPDEVAAQKRLRHAVCLLADSGRGDNPAYRPHSAYERALYLRCGDLDHEGRAFIAYALYARYDGSLDSKAGKIVTETVERLLPLPAMRLALRLGRILAFAEALSGGSAALLGDLALRVETGILQLTYARSAEALLSGPMRERFETLARDLHLTPLLRQT